MSHLLTVRIVTEAHDQKSFGKLCSSARAMAAAVKILDSMLFQFLHCRGEEVAGLEVSLSELLNVHPQPACQKRLLTSVCVAVHCHLRYRILSSGYKIRTFCRPRASFANTEVTSEAVSCLRWHCVPTSHPVSLLSVVDTTLTPRWGRQIGGSHLLRQDLFPDLFGKL